MRLKALLLLAGLGGSSLLLAGGCTQTCNQLCVENARYIDGCLEQWDALWPSLGYDGRRESEGPAQEPAGSQYDGGPAGEYIERCQGRYRAATTFSTVDSAREIRLACADDLQLLASSVNCDDYMPNDIELDPTAD